MPKRYWLFKSEPDVFSFQDLKNSPSQTTEWEGVRNYQARNLLRDEIQIGDELFFYHSRQSPMHIAGIAKVVRDAHPDRHQFDPRSKYFDPKSDPSNPTWVLVDVAFHRDFKRPVTLEELKSTPGLENMMLLRKGARLSIQPVSPEEWKVVIALGMSGGSDKKTKPDGKNDPRTVAAQSARTADQPGRLRGNPPKADRHPRPGTEAAEPDQRKRAGATVPKRRQQ